MNLTSTMMSDSRNSMLDQVIVDIELISSLAKENILLIARLKIGNLHDCFGVYNVISLLAYALKLCFRSSSISLCNLFRSQAGDAFSSRWISDQRWR